MQQRRNRLESILPEISPAIDELASSAVDAKSANDSRLSSISTMRSTLGAHCAKVAEALAGGYQRHRARPGKPGGT